MVASPGFEPAETPAKCALFVRGQETLELRAYHAVRANRSLGTQKGRKKTAEFRQFSLWEALPRVKTDRQHGSLRSPRAL